MPDGFDPHVELERIHTLRELMTECRQRVPKVLAILDGMLDNPDAMTASEKMSLCDMVWNRAYGKPRQHVMVSEGTNNAGSRVQVYIPDNGRINVPQKTIDVEAA